MSYSDDLTFGHDSNRDVVLNRLYDELGDFHDDPLTMLAALIGLDEHYGLRRDDDFVLVHPVMGMWLLAQIKFADKQMAARMDAIQSDQERTDRDEIAAELEAEQLLCAQPFQALIESPESDEYTEQYPAAVRGKTLRMRFMRADEMPDMAMMYTVHADGAVIYLPQRTNDIGHRLPDRV